ncbi:F0F1 ATP synthase subunit B' [Lichenihabitans sp. PAMC28606]|uniref:F0F1 ATP synthase subunit B family protein n=1 Tax=Lichenihabitans sp. PAMC28606 TaxID=2880932 RepID=UPI001D0B43C7|nr:F0F1 ATP synthase subunit B' [Lichenihabitans sp. PAMC28606]UDL96340.1 F0F1 ATP synthase subunit B' [Lichenihabitans sp. PAMC28606]
MAVPVSSESLPAGIVNNPDAGHQVGVFPPFDAHNFVPQIIWLVIIFGALYWLMSRIALPRVENILEARRGRIEGDLSDARSMQDQAHAAGVSYDKTLADAKGRAQAMAQQTHDALHAESEAKRHALETALNAKLATADAQINETKTRAMSNVETIARDTASAIVQHLTGTAPSAEAVAAAAAKPN